ncbi:MAG: hypothetical protein ACREIV_15520 [Planctomycetaceae bacterium]
MLGESNSGRLQNASSTFAFSTANQAEDTLPVESQITELSGAVAAAGTTCEVVQDGISGTDFEGRPVRV